MENSEIIFIIGAHKTATSTLVGMLNCHPEIFLLYENELYQPHISRHAKRFLAQYPDARFLFRSSEDLQTLYSQLQEFLKSKGYPYKYVGDKLPGLNANFHVTLNAFKVIFSVRDIRTWLGKDLVVRKYGMKQDVIPAAIDYSICFLKSFKLSQVFHVRMEDLISQNEMLLKELGKFLSLDLNHDIQNWWKKIPITDKNNPKASDPWWETHDSSLRQPKENDTVTQMSPHPFWEEILPVFDKYYQNLRGGSSPSEIDQDITTLLHLKKYSPLSPQQAFTHRESHSISQSEREKSNKNIIKKVLKTLGLARTAIL